MTYTPGTVNMRLEFYALDMLRRARVIKFDPFAGVTGPTERMARMRPVFEANAQEKFPPRGVATYAEVWTSIYGEPLHTPGETACLL